MAEDNARIEDAAARHRYELTVDGEVAGMIQYELGEGTIELIHTEVDPRFEGHGYAGRLAQFALEDAKRRGLKVIPSCSYVRKYLQRHPEYESLVAGR